MFQYIVVVKLNTSDVAITSAVDSTITTDVDTTILPEQYMLRPYHGHRDYCYHGRKYYYNTRAVHTRALPWP